MSKKNRIIGMIIPLLLLGIAPALAQTAPSTTQHMPLQKAIGQAKPEIVPSLIVINARRREPARWAACVNRHGTEFDRLRRPPGAGGWPLTHDRFAGGMV